jgi:centromeric protein E
MFRVYLQYELEKEKLELELQEERKSQLEREQRIREQELKIENLSSLVNTSTFDDTLNKVINTRSSLKDVVMSLGSFHVFVAEDVLG